MSEMVSGKIIRKWVKPGTRGNTIGFVVLDHGQEKMVSVFESTLSPETKPVIMALVEGMFAEFDVIPNVSKKDGKTYLNIVGATPVTQLREDVVVAPPAPVQPMGQPGKPEGDTKVRSMALAYSKDKHIASGDWDNEAIVATAKRYEQYILTGE
jgi:hypothetical protein